MKRFKWIIGPLALQLVIACAAMADPLVSTDFTGRTVSGATASNITWTLDGFADPGDLTAVKETPEDNATFGGLFSTGASAGYFAVDRNLGNEGPWSVDIPLTLTAPQIDVESVFIDWRDFTNTGGLQGAARDKIFTATIRNSSLVQLGTAFVNTADAVDGADTITFASPVTLTNADTYTLNVFAEHGSDTDGNNTSIDALTINGTIVPEPSAFALTTLGLLGLLGWRRRRR